jgi:hypothetical protein
MTSPPSRPAEPAWPPFTEWVLAGLLRLRPVATRPAGPTRPRWFASLPHRDELRDLWELSVFLDVPFDVTAARMAARDGSTPDPHHPSVRRCVDAQRTYFKSARRLYAPTS